MLETLVIGPIAASGVGIVRHCVDCRSAAEDVSRPCPGYGAGCLLGSPRPTSQASADTPPAAKPALR